MRRILGVAAVVAALAASGQLATGHTTAKASGQVHVVKAGETLSGIASRYGTTTAAVARANNISNLNVIVIGRKLTIPAGTGGTAGAAGTGTSTGKLPAKLQARPERLALRPTFDKWAGHYAVPSDLLQALAWMESGWQAGVVSRTGAIGVGQLQPATVDHVRLLIGIKTLDPYNPDDNIRMSARFLRFLLDSTGGDVNTALAAYYQGLRSVRTSPILTETKQYVTAVLALRPMFR